MTKQLERLQWCYTYRKMVFVNLVAFWRKNMAPAILAMAYLFSQECNFVVILNLILPYYKLNGFIVYSFVVCVLNEKGWFETVPEFSGFSWIQVPLPKIKQVPVLTRRSTFLDSSLLYVYAELLLLYVRKQNAQSKSFFSTQHHHASFFSTQRLAW